MIKHYPRLIAFLTLLLSVPLLTGSGYGTAGRQQESRVAALKGFPGSNPFARPSPLLYRAPQFDKIHDSDYKPALEMGMREQLEEIDKIASDPAPETFENTIVAMERSGDLLTRVSKVFFAVVQATTDDTLQNLLSS